MNTSLPLKRLLHRLLSLHHTTPTHNYSTQFKDYTKSPIGFGVVVFLVTKQPNKDLFVRFYEAFASRGEANIPIDKGEVRDSG
jgi:hypothetical protein